MHPLTLTRAHRTTPGWLCRSISALALGVSALALAVPTALPAAAAPGGPSDATSGAAAASEKSTPAKKSTVHAKRLTAAAQQAGLEVGNATMGWRERGTERTLPTERSSGVLRYGRAAASSTSSKAPAFTPKGPLGIDIASYQRSIKFSTWTKKNRTFVYVKATEGTSYRNPYFTKQTTGATKAGMIHGAYHFASPNGKAGYRQARYFVQHGGAWKGDGKTLPGVLDIEYNPYGSTCYGRSKKKMVAWISSFTLEYKRLTGRDVVIYTTTDWWTRCTGNSSAFAKTNPLWIARYGTTKPGKLPKGWTYATFWQYTSTPIDQDVFSNTMKRLKVLAGKKAVAKGRAS